MKLALIHYSAPPVVGGVERVVGEQIATLRAFGHHVSLACFEGGQATSADVHIPLSRSSSAAELTAYLGSALCDMDAVLMHNVGTMHFAPALTEALRALAGRLSSVRWICWVHDIALLNPSYAQSISAEHRALLQSPCELWEYVAVSESRAAEVRELLQRPCPVIPNGIDPASTLQIAPQVAELAEKTGAWESDILLLHPARLLPRKNIEMGLELTAELRSRNHSVQYWVTGAGDPHNPASRDYAESLRQRRRELGLEGHFHFVNDLFPVGPRELASLYRVADALFLPSHSEGFGLPVLEAALFGIPTFCPDREPMNGLPGAVCYPDGMPVAELGSLVIHHTGNRDTIQARKTLLRSYRWPSIYQTHLLPLLTHKFGFRPVLSCP